MIEIKLEDNNYEGKKIDLSKLSDEEKLRVRKALNKINNVSLRDLENRGIIAFTSRTDKRELNEENTIVFSVLNLESDLPVIQTRNIMGFFSLDNTVHIEITSRFDDDNHFFLHYMLQKVCNISSVSDITHAGENQFYEYSIYLFPSFLQRALKQGIFRTYISKTYNDLNVRGVIDFPQCIKNNYPFNLKMAYWVHEYSQDNYMTQLIRHTIEFISEKENQRTILSIDEEMNNLVAQIRTCTENYNKTLRDYIIQKNLNTVMHPYYTEYEPLRKLCLMILSNNKTSFGNAKQNQIYGLLFDGASLWEEYLNVIFQEKIKKEKIQYHLEHTNNRSGKGKQYLFETNDGKNLAAIYPDFLLKDSKQEIHVIIDAKYKYLKNGNSRQEDYYQILSYMFRFNCTRGILVYPKNENSEEQNSNELYLKNHEKRISLEKLALNIPDTEFEETSETSYKNFCKRMGEKENLLVDKILAVKDFR